MDTGLQPISGTLRVFIYKKEMQIAEVIRIARPLHIPIRNASSGASGATD